VCEYMWIKFEKQICHISVSHALYKHSLLAVYVLYREVVGIRTSLIKSSSTFILMKVSSFSCFRLQTVRYRSNFWLIICLLDWLLIIIITVYLRKLFYENVTDSTVMMLYALRSSLNVLGDVSVHVLMTKWVNNELPND